MNAYRELANNRVPEGENPVIKIPLMVTGDDASVFIDLLINDAEEGEERSETSMTNVVPVSAGTRTTQTADIRRIHRLGKQELHYMNSL